MIEASIYQKGYITSNSYTDETGDSVPNPHIVANLTNASNSSA
jgi:hypothetical protein